MTPEEQAAAAKAESDAKAQADSDAKVAEAANGEKPIGEILDEGKTKKKDDNSDKVVPEAAFLDEKKGRKAAEKRIKELEDSIRDGATKGEIKADVDEIAKKYNVDPGFLKEYTASIEASLREGMAEETDKKLRPIAERDRQERIDKVFDEHFASAMERMPEFKTIVNKSAIKALTLNPANANKTFTQIIEDTYGAAVPGKRSIEQNRPGGGKESGEIDYDRAKKDTVYFKELMSDPSTKKKYNDGMIGRLGNSL